VQRRDLCKKLAAAIHSEAQTLRPPPPSSATTMTVVVVGDTRSGDGAPWGVLDRAATEAPNLVLHLGDVVSSIDETGWQAWFNDAQSLLKGIPVAAVPGERDRAPFGGADRFAQLFGLGTTSALRSYAVDAGPVHVAMLDSNDGLSDQAAWLERDLTDAETRGARHLFVAMHWGPFSSGPTGGNPEALSEIVPVVRRHRVEAILSAHDNIYEHGVSAGLHYFVTGGAGRHVDVPKPVAETVTAISTPHYLVMHIDGDAVQVQARGRSGTLFDDVTLR
jgi:hypothetical protein